MRHLYLSAALVAVLTTPALAQEAQTPPLNDCEIQSTDCDIELQDTVISLGERIGSPYRNELTSPSSIISQAEISARGNAYIADLLRTIPGASVNRSGPAGSLTQIRLRGSEGNHVLVLIDGVEVSNPNTGEFDFASLRARDVLKIEVLRGEQSALWGSDAIGGVINIITRARATQKSYSASIEGGSFGTGEAQISAVLPLTIFPIRGASLSINGNVFKTSGYDVSGLNGEKDGAESRALNIGLNNVNIGALNLSGVFSTNTAMTQFDSDTTFNGRLENTSGETETKTQTGRVSAGFNLVGFEHVLNLSFTDTDQTTTGTSFPNDTTGKRTQLNWAAKKSWDAHNLTLLVETEKETFSNFGGTGAGQNQKQSTQNHALAADYRYNANALTLTASARQDFNDRFEDSATWRVGAGYAFENLGGRVRASIGTGVKNPSMTELFGFFPASFIGNPDLKPEKSQGYNIGYDQEFANGDLSFSIDYFRSDLENEIFTDFGVFPSTAHNRTTDSKREGIELETRWQLTNTVKLHASATFMDTKENDVQELRRPEFLASGTLTWQPVKQLHLTLSADHTGSQIDTDFGTFSRVTLDAFTLVGLNASWALNDTISVSIRAENLLDDNYEEVVGYASQGRGVYAGLNAHF
ncbi:MAG: TonB-dependent receptor [Robiginitomaculum sp.]|nr:MAG: TonB-dependent receptor [Robiginitomaculum sp.]